MFIQRKIDRMKTTSCSCEKCIKCCWNNPGWFGKKEEIVGATKIMDCSLYDFAQKYLVREYWCGEDENIHIPAPIRDVSRISKEKEEQLIEMEKLSLSCGFTRDAYQKEIRDCANFGIAPWGYNLIKGYPCIFLDDNNLCKIQDSKPSECRDSYGCKSTKKGKDRRPSYVRYWKNHQDWIRNNLIKEE